MAKLIEETKIVPVISPKHPQYTTASSRLASYEIWPRSMKQCPENLTDAGFYYTGMKINNPKNLKPSIRCVHLCCKLNKLILHTFCSCVFC